MTNYRDNWIEYQNFAQKEWHNANKYLYNNLTLKELIEKSETYPAKDFSVDAELSWGIYIRTSFTTDNSIISKYCDLWIADSINYPPDIFSFIEAIILSDEKEFFYFCDEEGPETFLYVRNLENNFIRFVHISQKSQYGKYIQTEDYKVRMDITIDKTKFIKTFYFALVNEIKNANRIELEKDILFDREVFEDLQKASPIVEEYLKKHFEQK